MKLYYQELFGNMKHSLDEAKAILASFENYIQQHTMQLEMVDR
jgi:hypothetical protein